MKESETYKVGVTVHHKKLGHNGARCLLCETTDRNEHLDRRVASGGARLVEVLVGRMGQEHVSSTVNFT